MCVLSVYIFFVFFFFKQKTAYEMRISDWSSDVCSSDLGCLNGSDAPGDSDAGTVETAFTALRGAENPANVFALGGLLAQEQPHNRPSDSRGSWSCWDRACRAPPRAAANKRHAPETAVPGGKGSCGRSEERRAGKDRGRTGRAWWW